MSNLQERTEQLITLINKLSIEGKITPKHIDTVSQLLENCEKPNGSQIVNEHVCEIYKARTKTEIFSDDYERYQIQRYPDNDPRYKCVLRVHGTEEAFSAIGRSKKEALDKACDRYIASESARISPALLRRHIPSCLVAEPESSVASMSVSVANDTANVSGTIPIGVIHSEEIISLDEFQKFSTDPSFAPEALTNRWVMVDQFTWKESKLGSEDAATNYRRYNLPLALTANTANLYDSQSLSVVRLNRLMRTGMQVMIDCPANPLASGQLFAKWFYDLSSDRDALWRYSNPYTLSHGEFAKIRPGGKESASFHIGFNSRNAAVSNQTSIYDNESVMNMGALVIAVNTPLRVADDATNRAVVRVMIKFDSMELHGRKPGGVLTTPKATKAWNPEGPIADVLNSSVASPIVNTLHDVDTMVGSVRRTENQDKPPDPFSKCVVIPSYMNSLAYSTGITTNNNSLRMVAGGMKPSNLKIDGSGPFKQIIQDNALYQMKEWKTGDAVGTVLFKFPIEAFHAANVKIYPTITTPGTTGGTGIAVPPVDILSSCFTYCSGTLQYTIEVISTERHNGALKICTFPLADVSEIADADLGIYALNDVKGETITLGQLNTSAVVQSDYHNVNPIFGIRSSDEFAKAPRRSMGVMVVVVQNPLETSVGSPTIDINLYKCGASDFEVLVSKNSVLVPAFDAPDGVNPKNFLTATSGNTDFYFQASPAINFGTETAGKNLVPVLQSSKVFDSPEIFKPRQGAVTAHTTAKILLRSPGGAPVEVRFAVVSPDASKNYKIPELSPTKTFQSIRFAKVLMFPYGGGWVAIPICAQFRETASGNYTTPSDDYYTGYNAAIRTYLATPSDTNLRAFAKFCVQTADKTDFLSVVGNRPNSQVILENSGPVIDNFFPPAVAVAQGPEANSGAEGVSIPTTSSPSQAFGGKIFDEKIDNVKDIMRQPRYITSVNYTPSKDPQWPYASVAIRARHLQPPPDLVDVINHHCRWPKQMLLATGYTWVSGGIDWQIILPSIDNTMAWIQYRPHDKPATDSTITRYEGVTGPTYLNGPAGNIISLKINNHISETTPYLNENVRNVLMRMPVSADGKCTLKDKGMAQCYDLGQLTLGFFSHSVIKDDATYQILIFSNWSDDVEMSGYRGFPPMRHLSDVNNYTPESAEWSVSSKLRNKEAHALNGNTVLSTMLSGFTSNAMGDALKSDAVTQQIAALKEDIANSIVENKDEALRLITEHMTKLTNGLMSASQESIMNRLGEIIVGQSVHFFLNPTIKTAIVCIASTLAQAGFFCSKILQGFISLVTQFFSPEQPEEGTVGAEAETSEGDRKSLLKGVISLLVTGICSKIAWNHPAVNNIDWTKKLAFAVSGFTGMAVSVYKFIDLIFPVLEYLYSSIIEMKVKLVDGAFEYRIMKSENFLTSWITEVDALCSRKFEGELTTVDGQNRVVLAHHVGKAIEKTCLKKRIPGSHILTKRVKDIGDVYNRLENEGMKAIVREEPYVMYIYGEAGIGKSHFADMFETELCKRNNIDIPSEKTLIVQPTSQYLNRVRGQPCLRIDDFAAVTSEVHIAAQLSLIFEGVTSAAWCPNQASLEDKNRLYAPQLFTILSNSCLPAAVAVADKSALLRRRNVTMHIVKNEEHFANMSEADQKECAELFAKGKKLGHLPKKFKETEESKQNHIRIVFETVPAEYPLVPPVVTFIGGKSRFTYEEVMEIVDEDFKEFKESAKHSFRMRFENHYRAKRQDIPDFSLLIDESNEPALGLHIRNLLAIHEGDDVMIESTRRALEACGFAGSNKYQHILETRYRTGTKMAAPEGALVPSGSRESFLAGYDEKAEYVSQILDELETKGVVKYNRNYEFVENGNVLPLSYCVLRHRSPCNHKITGDAKADFEMLMNEDFACTSNCIVRQPHMKELLEACLVQMDCDPVPYMTKMKKYFERVPTCIKQFVARARANFDGLVSKMMGRVKIMGVSLLDFMKKYWKPIALAIGGMAAVMLVRRNPSLPGSTFVISSTDRAADLACDGYSMLAHGVGVAVDKVKHFRWTKDAEAEAYNPKIHVQTKTVRPTGKVVKAAHPEGNLGGRDVTDFKKHYKQMICTMNKDYVARGGKPIMRIPIFALGGHDYSLVLHSWEIIARYAESIEIEVHRVGKESFTKSVTIGEITVSSPEHYTPDGRFRKYGNFVVLTFPPYFPPAKSLIRTKPSCGLYPCTDNCPRIIKSSVFQDAHTSNNSGIATLLVPPVETADGEILMTVYSGLEYYNPDEEVMVNPVVVGGTEVSSRTYYSDNLVYDVHGKGFCNGLLIDEGSGKIVGFHYSGLDGKGVSERVSTEMFRATEFEYTERDFEEIDDSFDAIPGVIVPLGIATNKKHQPSKTAIAESAIFGAVEVTTRPAALCPADREAMGGQPTSPLYDGVLKHGMPPGDFPPEHLAIAAHDYRSVILAIKPTMRDEKGNVRQPTIDEALFGREGIYNSMDFSTGLGDGWDGYRAEGKNGIADKENRTIKRVLHDKLTDIIHQIKNRTVPFVLAEDCLKDETRELLKICFPRIISTLPWDLQIMLRVYTMEFTRSHQIHNFESEHAIGMNVDSDDVHLMVSSLHGRNIIAGDFSNFGPGASTQVALICLDIIVDWYRLHGASEAFCIECRTILQVLICTPHIAYDKVYRTVCGIISGSAITVVLNTMIHSMYMRLAALGLGITMKEFREGVRLYTYGDDGIAGVTDDLIKRYNMVTLQEYFASKNIKYTNPDKTDEIAETMPLITTDTIKGTSFLKHSFRLVGGKYIACLKKSSIENQINWVSKKGDRLENTIVNVQNALRQAYMHGKEYYDELESKCARAFALKGKRVVLPSYEEETMSRAIRGLTIF